MQTMSPGRGPFVSLGSSDRQEIRLCTGMRTHALVPKLGVLSGWHFCLCCIWRPHVSPSGTWASMNFQQHVRPVALLKTSVFNGPLEKSKAARFSWSQTKPPWKILHYGVKSKLSLEREGKLWRIFLVPFFLMYLRAVPFSPLSEHGIIACNKKSTHPATV